MIKNDQNHEIIMEIMINLIILVILVISDQFLIDFSSISDQFLMNFCRFLQISAEIGIFCTRYHQRPADAASGPSPTQPPCPSRNIEKSLIFLVFLRGAASCGSGRPMPRPRARQRLAGMGQNVQKSRRICRILRNSSEICRN